MKQILNILKKIVIKYYSIWKWKKLNPHNQTRPGTIFPNTFVKVGSYTYGILNVIIYDTKNKIDKLLIGNFVSIADDVKFFLCENHQTNTLTTFPLKSILNKKQYPQDAISNGSIIIEDEVWIGYGVKILSGVTIGKGAIIATGAVVSNDIPPYTIAGGVPAKVIKNRFSEEITNQLLKIKLIDLDAEIISKNIEEFYRKIKTVEDLRNIENLFEKHRKLL